MKLLVILIVTFSTQAFSAEIKVNHYATPMLFLDMNDWTDVFKQIMKNVDQGTYNQSLLDEDADMPSLRVLRKARWTA